MPSPELVWIIDDDQSIRFVLEKALAREGLPVRSFTNPRDVLAALEVDEPQVLVSDIRMPGGSGIDLSGWSVVREALRGHAGTQVDVFSPELLGVLGP